MAGRIGDTVGYADSDSTYLVPVRDAPRIALACPLLRALVIWYTARFSDLVKKAAAQAAAFFVLASAFW
jgi:hypothetical protein